MFESEPPNSSVRIIGKSERKVQQTVTMSTHEFDYSNDPSRSQGAFRGTTTCGMTYHNFFLQGVTRGVLDNRYHKIGRAWGATILLLQRAFADGYSCRLAKAFSAGLL